MIDRKGWSKVKFGDVVRLSKDRSSDPIANGYDRYIGLDHIEPEDLRIRRWGNVADGVTFTSVFKPGQVLFGKRRAYQRKVAVADFAGVCSGDIYVLESKDPQKFLPELLPFICQTETFFQHAVGTSAGSLSPRTNWTSLADFEFALPPLEEQRRISYMLQSIETVNEALDDATIRADSLLRALSRKEFSKEACEGELLASHYTVVSGQVDPKAERYADLPLIAPNHIKSNSGQILNIESASDQLAISGKYLFGEGAVLYSKIRPNLVKAAIAPCTGLCSADMYALLPKDSLRGEYLLEILLSDTFTQFAISGSMRTGIPKLNREHLSQYQCRVPSLTSQDDFLVLVRAIRSSINEIITRRKKSNELKSMVLLEV